MASKCKQLDDIASNWCATCSSGAPSPGFGGEVCGIRQREKCSETKRAEGIEPESSVTGYRYCHRGTQCIGKAGDAAPFYASNFHHCHHLHWWDHLGADANSPGIWNLRDRNFHREHLHAFWRS